MKIAVPKLAGLYDIKNNQPEPLLVRPKLFSVKLDCEIPLTDA